MERREGSQGQAADPCRDEQAAVPIRLGDDAGIGQTCADRRGGDDQCDEDLHEQKEEPVRDVDDEPGQHRYSRVLLLT